MILKIYILHNYEKHIYSIKSYHTFFWYHNCNDLTNRQTVKYNFEYFDMYLKLTLTILFFHPSNSLACLSLKTYFFT